MSKIQISIWVSRILDRRVGDFFSRPATFPVPQGESWTYISQCLTIRSWTRHWEGHFLSFPSPYCSWSNRLPRGEKKKLWSQEKHREKYVTKREWVLGFGSCSEWCFSSLTTYNSVFGHLPWFRSFVSLQTNRHLSHNIIIVSSLFVPIWISQMLTYKKAKIMSLITDITTEDEMIKRFLNQPLGQYSYNSLCI